MRQRRGFILLLALAMLALVGVAILALGAACSSDGQRTMYRSQRAQLDQMLLAGATEAREHLAKSSPKSGDEWKVELPSGLVEQSASLHSSVDSIDPAGQVIVNVRATLSNRSETQTLKLAHFPDGWKLVSAEAPL